MTDEMQNGAPAEEIAIVTVIVTDGDGAALPPAPAPEAEPAPAPESEPIPLPENLETWELDQQDPEEGAPAPKFAITSLAEAERMMKRIKFFRLQADELAGVFDSDILQTQEQIKTLQAQVADLTQRKAEAVAPYRRREGFYLTSFRLYLEARIAADPKGPKNLKLPSGKASTKAEQPKWDYGDEKILAVWLDQNHPAAVRKPPVVAKDDFKELAKVDDKGKVFLANKETGELIEVPGVRVIDQPNSFKLEVTL